LKQKFSGFITKPKGTFDALKVIAKNDKMSGLYRGIGPTIASIAPFVAIQQVTYDLLKYKAGNMSMEPSVLLFVGCGSAAGVAAQTESGKVQR
jgi:solute carrier family 25 phosphate transporter 23/24/25/41